MPASLVGRPELEILPSDSPQLAEELDRKKIPFRMRGGSLKKLRKQKKSIGFTPALRDKAAD
jgi:hypothetical protein